MGRLDKVKTAILGCGMISNIYAKNLSHLFEIIDLVAVSDIAEETARQRADQFKTNVMDLDEICSSKEIELVVNLTPPFLHYETTKKLLEAGKHVFSEKMIATDLAQGKELLEIAAKNKVSLGVAPDTFLGAGLQTARYVIDSGLIGTPTSCFAAINRNMAVFSEYFTYIKNDGGCLAYDVGCYFLTALVSLLGPVAEVSGFRQTIPRTEGRLFWKGNYDETWECPGSNLMAGSLRFTNGILGNFHIDGASVSEQFAQVVIYGSEGILKLGDPGTFDGDVILLRNGSEEIHMPFTHGYKGTPLYGEPTPFDYAGHRGLGPAEMAWSIRKKRSCRTDGKLGVHILEILAGIEASSNSGRFYKMTTTMERPRPLPKGYMTEVLPGMRGDAEMSLML